MNVDHAQANELFSAYWDDELSAEQVKALEEHLRSCVACKKEYQTFEETMGSLGNAHKMAAPTDFAAGVRSQINRRSRGRFFGRRRQRFPFEMFSLVMLGLILAIYVVLQLVQPALLKLP